MKENLLKKETEAAENPHGGEARINEAVSAEKELEDKFRGEEPQKTKYRLTEEGLNGRNPESVGREGDDAAEDKETDAAKSGGHTAGASDIYRESEFNRKIGLSDVPEEIKNEIIKEYLININSANKTNKVFLSGGGMRTPVKKPTSVEEAGNMVKKFLIDKEN